MKRIKYACIEKTLHFLTKEGMDAAEIQKDVAHYKTTLERNRTLYKIQEETVQPDGSVLLKIKMQYNNTPVGDYLK